MDSSMPGTSSQIDAIDLESRIIQLCAQNPKGITNQQMQNGLPPNTEVEQKASAINRLLSMGKIHLLQSGDGLVYRLKDPEAAKNVKGADTEEKLIYQIIGASGNKGIWTRDIRFKSNLVPAQVNKILKSLESKKLIKAVKSVAASKKKVYMLYNEQPDRSVTGGAWYSDQEFESVFVEVLNQQCYNFLCQKAEVAQQTSKDPISQRNKSCATIKEIWKFIAEIGISKVELSMEDVEAILNTLIYDNKVEKSVMVNESLEASERTSYRAIKSLLPPTSLVMVPCGVCPLINSCQEGGIVSPSTCQYMSSWLEY